MEVTLLKLGSVEISYTPIKPKEYVAPVVMNSVMGLVLNPSGKVSSGTLKVLMILFVYKFVKLAKSGDIGKLVDLTLRYSINVVCFYVLPYMIHGLTQGKLNKDIVRELTYETSLLLGVEL